MTRKDKTKLSIQELRDAVGGDLPEDFMRFIVKDNPRRLKRHVCWVDLPPNEFTLSDVFELCSNDEDLDLVRRCKDWASFDLNAYASNLDEFCIFAIANGSGAVLISKNDGSVWVIFPSDIVDGQDVGRNSGIEFVARSFAAFLKNLEHETAYFERRISEDDELAAMLRKLKAEREQEVQAFLNSKGKETNS